MSNSNHVDAASFSIIRLEPWRSEFRFIARRNGEIIADTSSFDTAMAAFRKTEQAYVTLITGEQAT